MAKKVVVAEADSEKSLDELLGSDDIETMSKEQADKEKQEKADAVAKAKKDLQDLKDKAKADAIELKKKLKDEKAALKAKEKEEKAPREIKGIMVTFTNKAGETIKGKGVLYYVVRQDGKLHYKEASQVTVLPAEAPAA